jgi:ComF family protein
MEEDRGFQRGFYGYSFEGRVRDAIHSFKFEKRKDVGRYLTRLIGEKIVSLRGEFDCIVPVPVTEARLKSRGFNQSFIIAEEIGRLAERPVLHSVLFKTRDTEDQYTLDRRQRERNVRDAFAVLCDEGLKGKTVLLVDDLLTTGSTAKAATRALLGSDVKEVIFFALARTPS